jgi:hypothetical protein
VGEGSCLGNEACNQMDATTTGSIIIGDGSCHDNVACKFNEGEYREELLKRILKNLAFLHLAFILSLR